MAGGILRLNNIVILFIAVFLIAQFLFFKKSYINNSTPSTNLRSDCEKFIHDHKKTECSPCQCPKCETCQTCSSNNIFDQTPLLFYEREYDVMTPPDKDIRQTISGKRKELGDRQKHYSDLKCLRVKRDEPRPGTEHCRRNRDLLEKERKVFKERVDLLIEDEDLKETLKKNVLIEPEKYSEVLSLTRDSLHKYTIKDNYNDKEEYVYYPAPPKDWDGMFTIQEFVKKYIVSNPYLKQYEKTVEQTFSLLGEIPSEELHIPGELGTTEQKIKKGLFGHKDSLNPLIITHEELINSKSPPPCKLFVVFTGSGKKPLYSCMLKQATQVYKKYGLSICVITDRMFIPRRKGKLYEYLIHVVPAPKTQILDILKVSEKSRERYLSSELKNQNVAYADMIRFYYNQFINGVYVDLDFLVLKVYHYDRFATYDCRGWYNKYKSTDNTPYIGVTVFNLYGTKFLSDLIRIGYTRENAYRSRNCWNCFGTSTLSWLYYKHEKKYLNGKMALLCATRFEGTLFAMLGENSYGTNVLNKILDHLSVSYGVHLNSGGSGKPIRIKGDCTGVGGLFSALRLDECMSPAFDISGGDILRSFSNEFTVPLERADNILSPGCGEKAHFEEYFRFRRLGLLSNWMLPYDEENERDEVTLSFWNK